MCFKAGRTSCGGTDRQCAALDKGLCVWTVLLTDTQTPKLCVVQPINVESLTACRLYLKQVWFVGGGEGLEF
jgi:hypothetical protein